VSIGIFPYVVFVPLGTILAPMWAGMILAISNFHANNNVSEHSLTDANENHSHLDQTPHFGAENFCASANSSGNSCGLYVRLLYSAKSTFVKCIFRGCVVRLQKIYTWLFFQKVL
jgi:hypothetical protein